MTINTTDYSSLQISFVLDFGKLMLLKTERHSGLCTGSQPFGHLNSHISSLFASVVVIQFMSSSAYIVYNLIVILNGVVHAFKCVSALQTSGWISQTEIQSFVDLDVEQGQLVIQQCIVCLQWQIQDLQTASPGRGAAGAWEKRPRREDGGAAGARGVGCRLNT